MSKTSARAARTGQAEFVRGSGSLLDMRSDFKPRMVCDVDPSFFDQFS